MEDDDTVDNVLDIESDPDCAENVWPADVSMSLYDVSNAAQKITLLNVELKWFCHVTKYKVVTMSLLSKYTSGF